MATPTELCNRPCGPVDVKPITTGTVEVAKHAGKPVELYYEMYGNGPNKVMFVTGLASTCKAWEATAEILVAHGDYTVLTFDNRGCGHSTMVSAGYKIKDMAADALKLLEHLGWTKDVFLCGVSMGGMISMELALLAPPGQFAGLSLTSTHAGRTIPPFKTALNVISFSISGAKMTPEQKTRRLSYLIFAPKFLADKPAAHASNAEYKTNLEMICGMLMRHDKEKPTQTEEARFGQMHAINWHYVSKDRLDKIANMGIPVLITHGTEDPLIRFKNGPYLHKHIKGSRLEVFDGLGHGLMVEAPHRYHKVLHETFMSSPAFVKSATTVEAAAEVKAEETAVAEEAAEIKNPAVVDAKIEKEAMEVRKVDLQGVEPEADIDGEPASMPQSVAVAV
ncbi:hypothetical protein HK101_005028 [Irineochytrium annulatum]|nr:hypothetical protein HK101_005028 [Irineochytrium annulatum]